MSKKEKFGKKIVRILDWMLDMLILILILLLLFLGGYSMVDSHMVYQAASNTQYQVYKPDNDEELPSFADLQAMNPEVMSWLTVNRTGIDYPVCQGDNNEKYVNTSCMNQYSLSGSLFLDYENDPHYTDFNSIIYGHHMEKDNMFGDLDKFRKKAFFNSHKYGNLFFDGKNHGVEFFAFLEADAYDSSIYTVNVQGAEAQQAYLDNLMSRAKFHRNIGQSISDRILLLSTCSSDATNGRYILVGRISSKLHLQKAEKEEEAKILGVSTSGGFWKWVKGLPWWMWILLIFLIILFIILLVWLTDLVKRRKRKKQPPEPEPEDDGEQE